MQKNVIVVIPNWNGAKELPASIDSVLNQSYKDFDLIVVDNGSADESRQIIEDYQCKDPRVRGIYLDKNYGYTGGVNPGIDLAIAEKAAYVAPFNNDARADTDWLKHLLAFLESHSEYGIAACSLLHADGKTIDSTADQYTIWGIPFPRGRDEPANKRFNQSTTIFGASGGASMYRVAMLKKIGSFDQDFFAYYEDIDLSFRAQLTGWKVAYVPEAIVYHEQGKTSARIANRQANDRSASPFTTKQFMKNLPFILVKDMPAGLLWRVAPRFLLAYTIFFLRAFTDHRGKAALQGVALFWLKLPKKLWQRRRIQKSRKVSNEYLWSIFTHDLPPNAHKLRKLRSLWGRLTRKNTN
jgi:GT2 family glycosyltransferase